MASDGQPSIDRMPARLPRGKANGLRSLAVPAEAAPRRSMSCSPEPEPDWNARFSPDPIPRTSPNGKGDLLSVYDCAFRPPSRAKSSEPSAGVASPRTTRAGQDGSRYYDATGQNSKNVPRQPSPLGSGDSAAGVNSPRIPLNGHEGLRYYDATERAFRRNVMKAPRERHHESANSAAAGVASPQIPTGRDEMRYDDVTARNMMKMKLPCGPSPGLNPSARYASVIGPALNPSSNDADIESYRDAMNRDGVHHDDMTNRSIMKDSHVRKLAREYEMQLVRASRSSTSSLDYESQSSTSSRL